MEQLLAGQHPQVKEEIDGDLIRTDIPSSWGIIQQSGQAIAIVYLEATQPGDFYQQTFDHDGPTKLISN